MAIDVKLTDNELKSLISAGNTSAFKILFDRYYTQLAFFASKFTGDTREAEDIVMVIFSKFWQKKEIIVSIDNLSSYLYRSVKNACLDFLRKEARLSLLDKYVQEEEIDQNAIIEGEEVFARLVQQVFDQIENLPDQCKTVFKLIYIEGKSTKQVAEQLNLSIQTVRNQKTRGLNLVKAKISPPHLLPLIFMQIAILYSQGKL